MSKLKKYLKDIRLDLFLVFLVVISMSALNYVWLSYEKIPPHWDMARHLWTSLLYLNLLHWDRFWHLWSDYYYYPPFRYWLTLPFYLAFGTSTTVAVMSNIVFMLILAFSVYEIGRMTWSRSTGLLAMFGILCSPMFVGQFKEYQLDAQLSAMVALSFCLLLKTEEFSNKKYSMLFGLSFGFGMLTKWTFLCCLFLPLVYSAAKGIFFSKSADKERFVNFCWSAAIGASISLLWYTHPRMMWHDFFGNGVKSTDESLLTADAIFWYMVRLEWIQMYFFPTLLFFIGFLLSFLNKKWFEKNKYPFLFVAGCYFFFTILHHDCRYTMPMLAGSFIYVVYWFELVKSNILRIALITIFVLYCCFAFAAISMGTSLFPVHVEVAHIVLFDQYGYGVSGPDKTDWHQEEVFKIISEDKDPIKELAWEGPDPDHIRFNNWGIIYYALKYNVLLKEKKDHPEYLLIRSFMKIKKQPGYEPYREFVLPDQSFLYLYKKSI